MQGVFTYLFYLFRKDRSFYINLVRIIGFLPSHTFLYRIAFTHKSASIRLKDGSYVNNERLEYLGDAILGAVAAEFIYREFGHKNEEFYSYQYGDSHDDKLTSASGKCIEAPLWKCPGSSHWSNLSGQGV